MKRGMRKTLNENKCMGRVLRIYRDFYDKNLAPNTLNEERHIRRMRQKNKLDPILEISLQSKKKLEILNSTSYKRTE
jgi:hypothetical protein